MSLCSCPAGSLTSVQLGHDVVLQRCGQHEVQTWLIDGEPATASRVLPVLKDVFVEQRDRRPAAAPRQRTVVLPDTAARRPAQDQEPAVAVPQGPSDDQLTALLNARGLQGSWAIA